MKILTLCTLVASILFLNANVVASGMKRESLEKPNIVLFLVDDLGWADLGYRNPKFETPNIDALARDGVDFQSAYIASPSCSPSRGTLLTGKHAARLKLVRHIPSNKKYGFDAFGRTERETNIWETDPAKFPSVNWLALDHVTYAEALKNLGYYNQFIGKWHLGHEPYHPIHQGFDAQYGSLNSGHPNSYYPPYFKFPSVLADKKDEYLTEALTDQAVDFIAQYKRNQPFMLTYWYYAAHRPLIGKKEYVQYFKEKGLADDYAHYAAMLKSIDDSVGRIRAALKKKGMDKQTVILFLSDQGGAFENKPFHGGKMVDTLYEGGSRVPFIVSWPSVVSAGVKNSSIVQSTDLFPTLVDIAGGSTKGFQDLDGVSLLSTLRNNSTLNRGKPVFGYRAYEDLYVSARDGDWKLLGYRSGAKKLYNISNDIHEDNDVSLSQPKKVNELIEEIKVWEKEMGVDQYSGFQ